MGKFCQTCHSWEGNILQQNGDSFGICNNPGVAQKVMMDGKTNLQEDGTLWTEEYFGCVYWKEIEGILINLANSKKDGQSSDNTKGKG